MDPVLANPNGSRRPKLTTRGPSTNDQRITTCKLCPAGIYQGDDKVWGNGTELPVGWSHQGCADRHTAEAVGDSHQPAPAGTVTVVQGRSDSRA